MPDGLDELLASVAMTRQALKGMQRQARQTLQLATDLEERLDAYQQSIRSAIGGTANDQQDQNTQAVRVA